MSWPLAQEPKTIIDGGANVGYASLAFKRRWPEAYVLAIEPDSANLALLQKTMPT
jgi:FkbM family methyltransferase